MSYNSRKKKKNSNIFIGIIIAIGIILSIYILSIVDIPLFSNVSSSIIYGIDSFFSSISGMITEGTSYFGNIKVLNNKIEELEKKIEETEIELIEMKALEAENEDLREFLDINEKYSHFDKIYANVILRSYENWNESFIINKGKKDGIVEKQTVISKDGIVGFISNVEENISTVTTVLDTTSAISVEISNINQLAVVKSDSMLNSKGQMKLISIPIDAELAVGEVVYSSGIGEMYKKGIPVGNIIEIVNKKNDIDRYAIINVFTDITSLDIVAVIN